MGQQGDFLKECMNDPAISKAGPVPIDAFNRAYCVVCANRECSRSSLNGLSFDRRALNWKKDMFDSVPRADDSDRNYDQIRSKRFLDLASSVPSVETRQISQPDPQPQPRWFELKVEEAQPQAAEQAQPSVQAMAPPPAAPPTPAAPVEPAAFENTPFAQGMTLPGAPPEAKDVEVAPGGTFTFDDD